MSNIVSFRQMTDGTRDDYLLLDESERDYARQVPLRQPFDGGSKNPLSRLIGRKLLIGFQ